MTKRWSDESGTEAGNRNWGRFALALIPAALGGAAVLWLIAWMGWIDLSRARRIERRSMDSVGISAKPTAPIVVVNHDAACMKIESSLMDGNDVVFYVKNTCQQWRSLPNYSYRVKAHDGTVIGSERWAFSGDKSFAPGERREVRTRLGNDDRTERVELYVID